MNASQAGGAAHDAAAATDDNVAGRSPAHQQYFDRVAVDAERAVETVNQMIDDLRKSLPGRMTAAEQARAEAENGRV